MSFWNDLEKSTAGKGSIRIEPMYAVNSFVQFKIDRLDIDCNFFSTLLYKKKPA